MSGYRIRSIAVAATLAAVAVPAVAAAGPASAQGGKPGRTCTLTSTTTLPGVKEGQAKKYPAEDAGMVFLRRDAVNDGLIVGKVLPNAGWTKSVEVKTGAKVVVKFQGANVLKEFEAAQSAQYYGPDVLVIEVKTCT